MIITVDLETVESTYRTAYAVLDRVGAVERESLNIGATDKRGRAIGLSVARFDARLDVLHDTRTGDPIARGNDRSHGALEARPGTVYAWQPQALRDGHPYGPGQESRAFDSRDEREADIAAYIARFAKRHGR